MLSIINHQGNVKSQWDTTSHPLKWLKLKKLTSIQKDVEPLELSSVDERVEW